MEPSEYQGAPALENKQARQEALRRYHILDTAPERNFDRITRLVAQTCDVPTALITLLDTERQWFKSCFGYDGTRETDVEVSFCAHAVHQRDTLVVEDATQDARFAENPLVTGDPGWRFYAGAPLVTPEGVMIGTLCIIDYEPRVFDAGQRAILEDLADMVVGQLEVRSTEAQYRKLFQNHPQPALIYDIDTHEVLDANAAAAREYGYTEGELGALALEDLVAPASLAEHTDRQVEGSAPFTARHRRKDGTPLSVEVREESLLYEGRQARVATLIDVADRTRGRQYERLVENVQEVLFETDLEGEATFLNAAWEELTGFSREEALDDSLLQFVHPKDRVESLQAFAPLLQRRQDVLRHPTRFLTKDGRALPVQFRARLITGEDGTPVGTVGTLTPLAEIPSGEEIPPGEERTPAAPQREVPADTAPDTTPAPPAGEEPELEVAPLPETEADAVEELPAEEEPPAVEPPSTEEPLPAEEPPTEEDVPAAEDTPRDPSQARAADAEEEVLTPFAESEAPGASSTAPLEEEAHESEEAEETLDEELFAGLSGKLGETPEEEPPPVEPEDPFAPPVDASTEERAPEEPPLGREPSEEQASEKEFHSEELFSADEPAAPRPSSEEPAEPVGDEPPAPGDALSEEDFPALETVEQDMASGGGETLADVRERLSTDPPELRSTSFDYAEHLRTALDELEPAARRKGLMMHRALPDRPVAIEADPGALRLLVAALVNNAVASTDEGSITVSGRFEEQDNHVRLRVVDTGADISKSLLNSLLNVDAVETEEDEAAQERHIEFVHRLVNLMQGSVEMESQRGRGTVFTVTLPRRADDTTDVAVPADDDPFSAAATPSETASPAATAPSEAAPSETVPPQAASSEVRPTVEDPSGGDGADDWSSWGPSEEWGAASQEPAASEEAAASPERAERGEEEPDDTSWERDSIFSTSPEPEEDVEEDPDAFRTDPDSPFSF